jgi:hypothetical protein
MTPEQVHLLRSLGSGVRPVDLGERDADTGDQFNVLLQGALRGEPTTELGVTFAPSTSGMFDLDQRSRIARAIDLAAAAGSQHALILHDRQALRVDVRNRVVLEAPTTSDHEPITGIDAYVETRAQPKLEENDDETDEYYESPLQGFNPARVVRNASLVRALAPSEPLHDS